jgi:peroxiredoxin
MKEISMDQLCKGKKVVLFAVPGAFTPTCSMKHLPGFIDKADDLKGKGVETIACISVNDAFVMVRGRAAAWRRGGARGLGQRARQGLGRRRRRQQHSTAAPARAPPTTRPPRPPRPPQDAWGKSVGAGDKVLMLADGNGQFAKSLGVELDLADKGLGLRSRRYAMLVEDGVVKMLNLEEGGAFTVSSAESILEAL